MRMGIGLGLSLGVPSVMVGSRRTAPHPVVTVRRVAVAALPSHFHARQRTVVGGPVRIKSITRPALVARLDPVFSRNIQTAIKRTSVGGAVRAAAQVRPPIFAALDPRFFHLTE